MKPTFQQWLNRDRFYPIYSSYIKSINVWVDNSKFKLYSKPKYDLFKTGFSLILN